MPSNRYSPRYYNSSYQAPPVGTSPKKMIVLIFIAGVILIASTIFLSLLLSTKTLTLTCTQAIGEDANIQTLELTYVYRNNNLSSGKMHSVYKIEDEFTDEYVKSIKSTAEDDKSYESYEVNKINDHELTIDARISPEYTRQVVGDSYENAKDYLTKAGMTCN